ncbi:putative membrane protein [Bartonella australis AUST/NH1]|uniref:Putative membrane protein n=1 Tax=Bartonella australis (strain Aust/NH1) TaxID=1094489 RepID=M1N4Y8_BARAA|nr:putative membrane protein [Bartonella australis AUST/NH1]
MTEKRNRVGQRVHHEASQSKIVFICTVLVCASVLYFMIKAGIGFLFLKEEIPRQAPVELTIPAFDSRVYCKEISALAVPGTMKEVYQRCFAVESEAYFAVRKMWEKVSDKTKEKCIKMVRPGDGNYFLLRDCFMRENDDEKRKERAHF